MFKEGGWDDDAVKTYSFKSFSKSGKDGTSTANVNKKNKSKKRRDKNNEVPKVESMKIEKRERKKKDKKKLKLRVTLDMEEQGRPTANSALNKGADAGLLSKLRDNLKGSRFRYLNEQLYKTSGSGGFDLFNSRPEEFEAYHAGYRHQVEQWPMNPLRKIIDEVKKLPETHIIADFGCGDAKLAQSVAHKVYSIDLVSVRDDVIASDMANTPLKTGTIDVAVYCLSLMGVNLQDFFLEANRVLRKGGLLIISEITSRFESIDEFIRNVIKCGYKLERRETSHKMFVFFRFKKVQNVAKDCKSVPSFSLKPCLYKKR